MSITAELNRRHSAWALLQGRDDIKPQELRDLGVYGGGRGIWRDKANTSSLTSDADGAVVSVLHLGQRYANDLYHDGIVYHFPSNETLSYDQADIQSIKNSFDLELPIFVISHGKNKKLRRVDFGNIVDFGKNECLIIFGDQPFSTKESAALSTFKLNASKREKTKPVEQRYRDPMFRYYVTKRCGMQCAVCSISTPELLEAAHVKSVEAGGSDHPLNGIILCANHHKAFDKWLFNIRPNSGEIVFKSGITNTQLKIENSSVLDRAMPAKEALNWRNNKWKRHEHIID